MRNLNELNKNRIQIPGYVIGDAHEGAFKFRINGNNYLVIASDGCGWEHVSVSCESKIPTWDIMCKIKDLFFYDDEVVMQLHPKKEEYINNHTNCLHLWRPINEKIPTPPSILVGYKEDNIEK